MKKFEAFGEKERQGWSNKDIVDAYIKWFGPVTHQAASHMIATSNPNGKALLDLCCGHGEQTASGQLFEIFLTATVGAAMIIKSQTPEVIEAIQNQITHLVEQKFKSADSFRVPVGIAVLSAVHP